MLYLRIFYIIRIMKKILTLLSISLLLVSCGGQTPIGFNDEIVREINNADLYFELVTKTMLDSCLLNYNPEKVQNYQNGLSEKLQESVDNLNSIKDQSGGADFRIAARNYVKSLTSLNESMVKIITNFGDTIGGKDAKLQEAFNKAEKNTDHKRELLIWHQKQYAKKMNLKIQETPKFPSFPIKGQ